MLKYALDRIVMLRAQRARAIASGSGFTDAKSPKKWPRESQKDVAIKKLGTGVEGYAPTSDG